MGSPPQTPGPVLLLDVRPLTLPPSLFPHGTLLGLETGAIVEGPAETTVRYIGADLFRGIDVAPILHFALEVARDLPAAVVADLITIWLIRTFRGRSDSIEINRREIDLNEEGQVRRIVEEEMTIRR